MGINTGRHFQRTYQCFHFKIEVPCQKTRNVGYNLKTTTDIQMCSWTIRRLNLVIGAWKFTSFNYFLRRFRTCSISLPPRQGISMQKQASGKNLTGLYVFGQKAWCGAVKEDLVSIFSIFPLKRSKKDFFNIQFSIKGGLEHIFFSLAH